MASVPPYVAERVTESAVRVNRFLSLRSVLCIMLLDDLIQQEVADRFLHLALGQLERDPGRNLGDDLIPERLVEAQGCHVPHAIGKDGQREPVGTPTCPPPLETAQIICNQAVLLEKRTLILPISVIVAHKDRGESGAISLAGDTQVELH